MHQKYLLTQSYHKLNALKLFFFDIMPESNDIPR